MHTVQEWQPFPNNELRMALSPAVAVERLSGLSRQLVDALARHEHPVAQATLLNEMEDCPSQSTLSRGLSRLVQQGLVERKGRTRTALFFLPAGVRHFSLPVSQRPIVRFERDFVAKWARQQTQWVTEAIDTRLGAVASTTQAPTYAQNRANLADRSLSLEILKDSVGEVLLKQDAVLNVALPRTVAEIMGLHSQLFRGLVPVSELGRMRTDSFPLDRWPNSVYQPCPASDLEEVTSLWWEGVLIRLESAPLEAAFGAHMGMLLLQPFTAMNGWMGRRLAAMVLDKAGWPGFQFEGIELNEYRQASIFAMEAQDTSEMAKIWSNSYLHSMFRWPRPTPLVTPSDVELRERDAIDAVVSAYIDRALEGRPLPIRKLAEAHFPHLPSTQWQEVCSALRNIIEHLGPHNCMAWGVKPDEALRFATWRASKLEGQ